MIEYIKGILADLTPTTATVETAGGVAYLLNISLPTYSALQGKTDVRILVHESIREDAWLLYGFVDETERSHFRLLIGVSGVGAATAMLILSAIQGDELAAVISGGDVKSLKAVKGIGAKTAERIIVDLRDKIKVSDDTFIMQPSVSSTSFEEALAALQMLGFDLKSSRKVLKTLYDADPTLKVEAAIKKALTML